jgi:hypothetical protein
VEGRQTPEEIAAELEWRLTELRASVEGGLLGEEERGAHLAALDYLAAYVGLLRASGEAWSPASALAVAGSGRYLLKLELPDGRWDLVETPALAAPPTLGSVIELVVYGAWQVRGSEVVKPWPPNKPAYAFFVCAPAA